MKKYSVFVLFLSNVLLCIDLMGQVTNQSDVRISEAEYELEFYLNKDDVVNAELRVKKSYSYHGIGSFTIAESVFYDTNSEIKKIRKNGSKIKPVISDYQFDGIFHSDLKVCYFEVSSKKTAINVSYTKVFKDIKFINPFYFNDSYNTNISKLTIYKPTWIDLNIVEWNFEGFEIKKEQKTNKDEVVYSYQMDEVNTLKYDLGKPSFAQVFPHLLFNVKSATIDNVVQPYMRDVGDLYQWYRTLTLEIGNNNSVLKSTVSDLVEGKTSDIERIKSIYYWVQDNIRYVAFEYGIMGFQPESCQIVMKNKFGDCKGMANMTKEMLSLAGYDARLTWIGTNDLPYDYTIPSLNVDNHMICTVFLNGEPLFLDATEKYADLYHYASRIQGKQVLIEDGDKYMIKSIPINKKANLESVNQELRIVDDALIGKGVLELQGGRKVQILNYLKSLPKNKRQESLIRYINNQDKNVNLSLTENINMDQRDHPLQLSYELKIDNHIIDLGSELYLNTETDFTFKNFEKIVDRIIPYNFGEEIVISNNTKLIVPDNYMIDYMPKNLRIENEFYIVELEYKKEGNNIYYNKHMEIREKLLPVAQFNEWNEMLRRLKEFYSDQIILKKL